LTNVSIFDYQANANNSSQSSSELYSISGLAIINTGLSNIDWFYPAGASTSTSTSAGAGAGFFKMTDNPQLNSLNLSLVTDVTYNVTIARNGPQVTLLLPQLESCGGTLSIENVAVVELPLLSTCGALGLSSNSFDTFSAPKLKSTGSSGSGDGIVNISGNHMLSKLELPALHSVGDNKLGNDLIIEDNPLLETVSLPYLERVGSDIMLTGNFSK
jgi:hypothetical protein